MKMVINMEFKLKRFKEALEVSKIANIHYFEFTNQYHTFKDRHSFRELLYVDSGYILAEGENYSGIVKENQLIIHKADEIHSLTCPDRDASSVIIIGFECDSDLIDRFSYSPTEPVASVIRQLAEIVKEGRNVFKPPYNVPVYDMKKKKHQPMGSEQMLRILLECLLIRLIRGHSQSENDEKRTDTPLMTQEVVEYVTTNYKEKITIDELAFLFNTNRATLCKEFKRTTGKTVIGFINEKKYEKAKELILATQDTFTHISQELSFESIHYFTRFFKRRSGMTPKDFRNRYKAKDN